MLPRRDGQGGSWRKGLGLQKDVRVVYLDFNVKTDVRGEGLLETESNQAGQKKTKMRNLGNHNMLGSVCEVGQKKSRKSPEKVRYW